MRRRLALLIATYEYQDTGLRQLTAPAHDAEALATVLRDPEIADFEVITLVNEPHHQVGEAIGDFYQDRRRDDLTLLYFTGHGVKDDDGRLYLAMTNTRRDSLLFTALSAEQIDYAMSGSVSRQQVLILDCCYSGAFPAGRLPKSDTQVHALERFQGRGRTVLTASDATQYSFEGDRLRGTATRSVFTHYLVEGLRDGSADLNGDGDITVDELYSYAHDRVVDEMPRQRPKKLANVEGDTIIARNVLWTVPAPLRSAVGSPIVGDRLGVLDGLAHLHRTGNHLVRRRVAAHLIELANDDHTTVRTAARALLTTIGLQLPEPRNDPSQHATPAQRPVLPPETEVEALTAETHPAHAVTGDDPAVAPTADPHTIVASAIPQIAVPDQLTRRRGPKTALFAGCFLVVIAVVAVLIRNTIGSTPGATPGTTASTIPSPTVSQTSSADPRIVTIPTNSSTTGRSAHIAITPDGRFLYVTADNEVDVVDTQSKKMVAAVNVVTDGFVGSPAGVAVAPDGRHVYVTLQRAVVVDTGNNTVVGVIKLGGLPDQVKTAPHSSKAYVAMYDLGSNEFNALAVIDTTTTNNSTRTGTIKTPGVPWQVAISPDGGRAYLGMQNPNNGLYFNKVTVMDTASKSVIGDIQLNDAPDDLAITPDGQHLYISSADNIFVADTTTRAVNATIHNAGGTIAVAPNGKKAYSVSGSSDLKIIDTSTNTVTSTLPVRGDEIAVDPNNNRVYIVTNGAVKVVET